MKRYPLLIQLIVYVFVFILLLLGLVGSLYYQTSSANHWPTDRADNTQ